MDGGVPSGATAPPAYLPTGSIRGQGDPGAAAPREIGNAIELDDDRRFIGTVSSNDAWLR